MWISCSCRDSRDCLSKKETYTDVKVGRPILCPHTNLSDNQSQDMQQAPAHAHIVPRENYKVSPSVYWHSHTPCLLEFVEAVLRVDWTWGPRYFQKCHCVQSDVHIGVVICGQYESHCPHDRTEVTRNFVCEVVSAPSMCIFFERRRARHTEVRTQTCHFDGNRIMWGEVDVDSHSHRNCWKKYKWV